MNIDILSSGNEWESLTGGKIMIPDCGSIDPREVGYAAFFSQTGTRAIQTVPLDLTSAR